MGKHSASSQVLSLAVALIHIFIQSDVCLEEPALCQAPGKFHVEDRKELESHWAVLSLHHLPATLPSSHLIPTPIL